MPPLGSGRPDPVFTAQLRLWIEGLAAAK